MEVVESLRDYLKFYSADIRQKKLKHTVLVNKENFSHKYIAKQLKNILL